MDIEQVGSNRIYAFIAYHIIDPFLKPFFDYEKIEGEKQILKEDDWKARADLIQTKNAYAQGFYGREFWSGTDVSLLWMGVKRGSIFIAFIVSIEESQLTCVHVSGLPY